jgi:signal transduction histidine kinase
MALEYDDRDGINRRHALRRMISVGAASVLVVSVDLAKSLNLFASAAAQALPTVPIIVRDKTSLFGQVVLAGARKAGQDLGATVLAVCCILLLEIAMAIMLVDTRFSLGFYASRLYALIATIVVLLVLLSETTILYAYLAGSAVKKRQDREGRQIAMDVMAASIAHEINQPLGAMVTNANAALRWIANATPDLDEARAALTRIVKDGQRANQIIGGIRSMFKKDNHGRVQLGVNDLVREVTRMIEADLRTQRVSVSLELREGLPQVVADRGQLQQVFLNLCANAIEAMRFVDHARLLQIRSDIITESSYVMVTIEDSGTGIDGKNRDRIFEPFFTTKSSGTGIGLTICRSIIESHGGSLQVSANHPYGTIFHVSLPSRDS